MKFVSPLAAASAANGDTNVLFDFECRANNLVRCRSNMTIMSPAPHPFNTTGIGSGATCGVPNMKPCR